MKNLEIKDDRFEMIRDFREREYDNFKKDQPVRRALYNVSLILESIRWTNEQYLETIKSINKSDLQNFIPVLLSQLFIEAFYIGNINHLEAINDINKLTNILGYKPLFSGQFLDRRCIKLRKGKEYIYRMNALNPQDINSAIENYYQIGISNDLYLYNILDTFSAMTSNHGFNQLRTIEQLGYMVYVTYRIDNGVMGYRVLIQSNVKPPDYLDERIETWINSLEAFLTDMSSEEYENYISSLITVALEKDKSLKQESDRQKIEISHPHAYEFERKEKNARILKNIKKSKKF